ncbi:MAG: histidine decarboxylase [Halobacteriovoraceae bacterium]|jgi:histidine decarboxylase|nr:histidine decarboxylase [Halobacteriovoraceae bacterium]
MENYQRRLKEFYTYLQAKTERMIGYPSNQVYDYSELYDFFKLSINNLGDPLSNGPFKVKAHEFEKEVIEFVAEITGVADNNFWGYVTNGGTEGNMYGLYVAREMYPDSIVYYSEEAHYSIPKVLKLLKMPSIAISTNSNGEMDLKDLKNVLQVNRTKVPIFMATIGTTMKGAVDSVKGIQNCVRELAFPNHYIHCDSALSGMILPFCETAPGFGIIDGVHSFSISGHKMFGSPMPCGVVVAKKDYVDRIGSSIEYIGALDTTLSGSRNGHTPLLLWYAIKKHGFEGYKTTVQGCLAVADHIIDELAKHDIKAWRNKFSVTVIIPRPSQHIIDKWQIAIQNDIAHIVSMPHVTKEQIDLFIIDYVKDMT